MRRSDSDGFCNCCQAKIIWCRTCVGHNNFKQVYSNDCKPALVASFQSCYDIIPSSAAK
jgi:hypothetical protein